MKPKLKLMTKFLLFVTNFRIAAITLAPFGIYFKDKYINNKEVINHESIHWKQQLELLIIPFYILYILEWVIRMIIMPKRAYRSISFEREAFKYENDYTYLQNRKPYAWLKFYFND